MVYMTRKLFIITYMLICMPVFILNLNCYANPLDGKVVGGSAAITETKEKLQIEQ